MSVNQQQGLCSAALCMHKTAAVWRQSSMLIHVQTQHKWNTHLPQLQQFVGSDLPLWKNSQTDCVNLCESTVSF